MWFRLALASAGVACLCSAVTAQSGILIVDDDAGPGVDFTEISQAVMGARPYTVILVRSGNYGPFTVSNTSLVVAAEPAAVVNVAGLGETDAILVHDIGPGQTLVLQGLHAKGDPGYFGDPGSASLRVHDCAGEVWLQDCTLESGGSLYLATAGLELSNASQVVAVHDTIRGLGTYQGQESPGLLAVNSHVFLYESTVEGGAGVLNSFTAGDGVRVAGGLLFAEGSSIKGGAGGGLLGPFGCLSFSNGGIGLHLAGGSPQVTLFDTSVAGGPGDIVNFGSCGGPGPAQFIESGTLQTLAGPSLAFSLTSPVPDQGVATVSFKGTAGDLALVIIGLPGAAFYSPAYGGAWTAGAFPGVVTLGPIPPSGTLSFPAALPDLFAPGTSGLIVVQGAFVPAAGGKARLADPIALLIYDN